VSENPYDPPRIAGVEKKPDSPVKRLLKIGVLVLWVVALPFLVFSVIDGVKSARRSAERDEQRRLQQQCVPTPASTPALSRDP
jgi:hypothetical protein